MEIVAQNRPVKCRQHEKRPTEREPAFTSSSSNPFDASCRTRLKYQRKHPRISGVHAASCDELLGLHKLLTWLDEMISCDPGETSFRFGAVEPRLQEQNP